MKNHRFPWLRNRTTDNRKCEKACNIKEKRTMEMFSTASRPPVALRSSASAEFIPCFLQRLLLRQEPLLFETFLCLSGGGPHGARPTGIRQAAVGRGQCAPPCHAVLPVIPNQ